MRTCCWLAVWLMCATFACAQTTRPDQIAAATDNAVQQLRHQIRSIRIDRDITVGQFLDRTEGEHELVTTLARAQQIGGPRWLDDQTCQVRLEISGANVADKLKEIAAKAGKKSPVTVEYLEPRLRDMSKRRFSADGTSTSGDAAALVRPIREADGWAGVKDEDRRAAVCAAREDAAAKVLQNIRAVPLAQGKTVKDALDVKSVRDAVEGWLLKRPVTNLEFGADMQVRLGLSAPVDELFETFKSAATAQKQVPVPADAAAWNVVREGFASRVKHITGQAAAAMPDNKVMAAVQLPAAPPDWVNEDRSAEGASKPQKSKLKSARAAESDALVKLRSQLYTLPLNGGLTVGEAVKRDPRFNDAVGRALRQARTYKVDYESDSSARVKVNLDLRQLWEEIRSLP